MIRKDRLARGFTLMELLLVMGIVGVIVAIAAVSYAQVSKRGRDARRRADMSAIRQVLENYKLSESGGDGLAYPECAAEVPGDDQCLAQSEWSTIIAAVSGSAVVSSVPPEDPFAAQNPLYSYEVSCDGETCCGCALMEVTGGGNAYGRSGQTCLWSAPSPESTLDYYCFSGQADIRIP